jgi:hypothetical protein
LWWSGVLAWVCSAGKCALHEVAVVVDEAGQEPEWTMVPLPAGVRSMTWQTAAVPWSSATMRAPGVIWAGSRASPGKVCRYPGVVFVVEVGGDVGVVHR